MRCGTGGFQPRSRSQLDPGLEPACPAGSPQRQHANLATARILPLCGVSRSMVRARGSPASSRGSYEGWCVDGDWSGLRCFSGQSSHASPDCGPAAPPRTSRALSIHGWLREGSLVCPPCQPPPRGITSTRLATKHPRAAAPGPRPPPAARAPGPTGVPGRRCRSPAARCGSQHSNFADEVASLFATLVGDVRHSRARQDPPFEARPRHLPHLDRVQAQAVVQELRREARTREHMV